jgi:hypothetical protein
MGQNDKEQIGRIICYAIACFIAYNLLMALLPYIEGALAFIGVGYIYYQYQKNKWR